MDRMMPLVRKQTLVTLLNVALAVAVGAMLWQSLAWPLVGDAAIFHFIAGQMQMGAAPYRDIIDINMPLIYFVHAAVVAIGGMSDVAWRAFDLTAAALMSGLILMLVWPAGRAVAIQAVLIVLVIHLLLGPYAAGQRDFLMSILALAAALVSARAEEAPGAAGSICCWRARSPRRRRRSSPAASCFWHCRSSRWAGCDGARRRGSPAAPARPVFCCSQYWRRTARCGRSLR
jgi:hypothetical protein